MPSWAPRLLWKASAFFGREPLVGDDHLEVVAVFVGDEQVQLDGALVLPAVSEPNCVFHGCRSLGSRQAGRAFHACRSGGAGQ